MFRSYKPPGADPRHGGAGPAALPFTTVVILTVFSAKTFDPRLMWDAARRKS